MIRVQWSKTALTILKNKSRRKQKKQNLKQWALQGSCRHQTVAHLHRTPCQNWIWHLLPSHPNSRVCQYIRSKSIEMSLTPIRSQRKWWWIQLTQNKQSACLILSSLDPDSALAHSPYSLQHNCVGRCLNGLMFRRAWSRELSTNSVNWLI